MTKTTKPDAEVPTALISELLEAAIEQEPRSVFERRVLIGRALATIRQLRSDRDFDVVFDGKHSALQKVETVHKDILNAADHHVRAAMLIAAELLDMLQPSPVSPLGRALRERATMRIKKDDGSDKS